MDLLGIEPKLTAYEAVPLPLRDRSNKKNGRIGAKIGLWANHIGAGLNCHISTAPTFCHS